MTRINTNVSSLNAQKTLARNQQSLQQAMTRLSTGLRINSGKDDPAGMIAAAIQSNDIASTQMAISNTQRGSMLIGTADSALGQITNLLRDIRGLVTEVGNTAVMSSDQIAANQLQVDSALQAIDRISQVTQFQGQRLIDGSLDFINNAQAIPQIQNLQVDTANLGATGQMGVAVEVAAHAERADITTSSGEKQATTQLKFAARKLVDASVVLMAKSNSSEYDGVKVVVDVDAAYAVGGVVSYDSTTKTLSIQGQAATTWNTIAGVIAGDTNLNALFSVSNGLATALGADNSTTLNQTSLDITAVAKGIDFNNVKVTLQSSGAVAAATPTAVFNQATKELTITVNSTGADAINRFANATTFTALQTAINGTTLINGAKAFTTSFHTGSVGGDLVFGQLATDTAALANTSVTGYLNSAFSASTRAKATITLAAGANFAYTSGGPGTVDLKATSLGAQADNVKVTFTTGATKGAESAAYDELAKTLTVKIAAGATVADSSSINQIITAINATGAWKATELNGTGAAGFYAAGAVPAAFYTSTDSIGVESLNSGANFNNMQVQFELVDTGSGAVASYDQANNIFKIQIKNSDLAADKVKLQTISDAISAVSGFAGSVVSKSTGASGYVIGKNIDTAAVGNTGSTGGNTLLADLTLQLGAKDGTQVFTFNAGTSAKQVAAAVNVVSDATGLIAYQNNDLVDLKSAAYGSKAFIAANVISEGATGTFKRSVSSFRDTGSDVDAKINGMQAVSDGNKMWINTSSLAMTMDLQPEINGNFNFAISGGGAQFQLGPDVVSNQQLRVGIQSMNTARMGGVSGRLYQLGTGGSAALDTDPNLAAKIADEAISSVTSLRGRLGAIQGLSMDTNQKTLQDMVENMQTSLSQIQDTDFAAETANLTRAQILTQSGMAVLSIANQQPQQVLSLLPRG